MAQRWEVAVVMVATVQGGQGSQDGHLSLSNSVLQTLELVSEPSTVEVNGKVQDKEQDAVALTVCAVCAQLYAERELPGH